jgi:hypothetical protein
MLHPNINLFCNKTQKRTKKKKLKQVLQVFGLLIFTSIFLLDIYLDGPKDDFWEFMIYLHEPVGYGSAVTSRILMVYMGAVVTLLFGSEVIDYLKGNYKVFEPGKIKKQE